MSALIQTSFANETTAYWATEDQFITLSQAIANLSSDIQNWSTYPAVSTINASGQAITNISSLQLDDQILTALSGELLLNGVPIATISGISNVSDWAYYIALSNVDVNNFAINNVSGFELDGQQISAVGNTILVNGQNQTSNWANYNATANVNMSGFAISNTPTVSISGNTQNVVLTASGTNLLVDGQPVFTGVLPPSDTSNWATYAATANVNMSGFAISNTPTVSISGNTQNVVLTASGTNLLVDGQPVFTGVLPPSDTSNWATYAAVTNVNMSGFALTSGSSNGLDLSLGGKDVYIQTGGAGSCNCYIKGNVESGSITCKGVISQSNAGSGCNFFQSAVQVGVNGILPTDKLGQVIVYGVNTPVATSALYVQGGTTLDGGGTVHGITIGTQPVAGINTVRIDVLPVGMLLTSPTFITMNGLGAANIAMGGAVAIAAGSYVTLEHGGGLGANGIFLQNTARDGQCKVIMTGGGTFYNATSVQSSNIINPNGVQFWDGVYNPSGGGAPIAPAEFGRAVVDISSAGAYLANLTSGNLPASKNSNSVFIGNFPNLTTGGVSSTIAIGDISGMVGQSNYAIAIGSNAGQLYQDYDGIAIGTGAAFNAQGCNAIAIGNDAGAVTQGPDGIAIGRASGSSVQGVGAIAMGIQAGETNQGASGIALGFNAGLSDQGVAAIAIGSNAGNISQATEAVAIGVGAGYSNQGDQCIAMGLNAGSSSQGPNAVAIGNVAGNSGQGGSAVAIGNTAANVNQGSSAVAIGQLAGTTGQGDGAVAVGPVAGNGTQGVHAVAIGALAGQTAQGTNSVAIGYEAGQANQASNSFAMGPGAGKTTQGAGCVAVGYNAGESNQGIFGIAIGNVAAQNSQGTGSIAIGEAAATSNQGSNGIAIGFSSAAYSQGNNSVAIGEQAGLSNLGPSSIAIGSMATVCGGSFSNTIVLNATGAALNPSQANSCYIAPMQSIASATPGYDLMAYNTSTKEVVSAGALSTLSIENVISNTQQITYDTGLLTTTINGITNLQTVVTSGPVTIGNFVTPADLVVSGTITLTDASGATKTQVVAQPSFVYYVSKNGRVGATGAITDPLSTINAALAKLASAGPVDPPGMTIYVATGAYTEDVVVPISLTLPAVSIIGMGDDTDDSKRVQIRGSITINNTEASFVNTVNTVVINNIAVFAKNASTSAVTITGRGVRVYLKNGLYTQQSVSATAPLISLASSVAPPSNATNQLVIDNCSMSMSSATASGHIVNVASGQIFSINGSDLANSGTGSAINMAAGAFGGALNSTFSTLGAVMTIIQSAAGLTSLVSCTMSGRASPSVALITLGTNATLNLNESIVQNLDTTTEVNNTSRYIYTTSATGNLIVAIRSNITNSRAAATQITPFQAAVPAASQLLYFGNIYTNLTATLVGNLPAQGGVNWNAVRQFNTDTYTQQIQVTATSASAIVLSPTFRGRTIILTGTTTQPFSTAQLGAADVGFYVIAHNGNASGGGDINMTGMSGTAIIHNRTALQNGGDVYLYWTGAALVGY